MSGPRGQSSNPADDESSLTRSYSAREVSDFLPDTSTYFAAWAESIKPSLEAEDNPVSAKESCTQKPDEIEDALPAGEFTFEGSLRIDCCVKGVIPSRTGTLIVGETGEIEGDIFVPTAIVDGLVRGNIRATERVELGSQTGEVEADIFAPIAIIDGLVRGNIRASERLELGSNARVIGDIETPALSIQPGAIFEGRCHFLPALNKLDLQANGLDHADGPPASSLEFLGPAEEQEVPPMAAAAGC